MGEKGQVTLFIILGILLLIGVGLLLFLLFTSPDEVEEFPLLTQNVEFMIEDCIRDVGTEGLRQLGRNGNYINIPALVEVNDTSYWIIEYANIMPILNSSIDDFEAWFDVNFLGCVNYASFVGFDIETGGAKSTIEYGAEDVVISLNYPVNITQDGQSRSLEEFQQILNIRYRRVYERAKEIVTAHFIQFFNYRSALQFVDTRDFSITYTVSDENNLVFTIIDPVSIEGGDYIFNFATNLDNSQLKRTVHVDEESLEFFAPYQICSPDDMACLFLIQGVQVNFPDSSTEGDIVVWNDYSTVALRNVVNEVTYTIKGGLKPGPKKRTTLKWNLTYPVYNYEPSGINFSRKGTNVPFPQRLGIFWDEDKNPNSGPMGILYRGPQSSFEWVPMRSVADYNNSVVVTDILGFSEYTPIDCNLQQCKGVSVTSKNKPKSSLMCAIGQIFKTLLPILIIFVLILIIISGGGFLAVLSTIWSTLTGGGFFYALGFGQGLAVATSATSAFATFAASYVISIAAWTVVLAAASMVLPLVADTGFDSSDTAVSFVPTCDQIVETTCIKGGGFSSGTGRLNQEDLKVGGTKDITVSAGEAQQLTAIATKCKKKKFSCKSCKLTCLAAYK